MKKSFLLNIVFLILLNILVKPLWVFIEIEIQNKTGTTAFGLYFALFNLSLVLNMILDAGMVNFNNKKIAAKPHLTSTYFNRLIPIRFLLALIYCIILFIVGCVLQYSSTALWLLLSLGLNQILLAFLLFIRSNLQGMHFFKSDSIVSIADRLIMAAIILYLFYALPQKQFSIEWFVFIQTLGYLFAIILALLFLKLHGNLKFKPKFNIKFSIIYLKKCAPYALIGLLMLSYSFIDTVILERIRGEQEAGIYAQSSRLLLALSNFSYLFSVPLLPMFARMVAQKESYKELLRLASSLLILSSVFISVSCAFYAEEIISALYAKKEGLGLFQKLMLSINGELINIENTKEVKLSSDVFRIYILNFIPISCLYIYGTFLTAAGEIKAINISSALAVALNVCCNFALIPLYGVKGAALVSLITQSFVCIFQVYYMHRKFNIKIQYKITIRYIVSFIFFITLLLLLHQQSISWLLNLTLSISISLIIAIALKAIPTPHLSDFLKHKGT